MIRSLCRRESFPANSSNLILPRTRMECWHPSHTRYSLPEVSGINITCFWQLYESGEFDKQFQIRVLDGYPKHHYKIVDSVAFYSEGVHGPESDYRPIQIISPSCTNAPLYTREFNILWNKFDPNRKPIFTVPVSKRGKLIPSMKMPTINIPRAIRLKELDGT